MLVTNKISHLDDLNKSMYKMIKKYSDKIEMVFVTESKYSESVG